MSFNFSSGLSRELGSSGFTSANAPGAKDRRIAPCTLYLYSRPVMLEDGTRFPGANHWVLYFEWGHYSATYEANNVGDILQGSSYEGEPKSVNYLPYQIRVIKKNLRVNPNTVDYYAINNRYNRIRYNLASANCQHWVKELAAQLGCELPIDQFTDTAVTIGTIIGGAALVGALLGTAVKN